MAKQYICKVCADGLDPKKIEALKKDVQKSLKDPDHIIVTNFYFDLDFVEVKKNKK